MPAFVRSGEDGELRSGMHCASSASSSLCHACCISHGAVGLRVSWLPKYSKAAPR